MNKEKNIIIILIGVIIGLLTVIAVLFATHVVIFNTKKTTTNTVVENEGQEIVNNTTEEEEEENVFLYDDVINEYKEALEKDPDGYVEDTTFKYVNGSDYLTYEMFQGEDWYYTTYDIDKNGIEELLMGYYYDFNNQYTVSAIFTYNNGIVKVQDYWSRNSLLNIYENGMITAYGSNGASSSSYVFGTIDNIEENIYNVEVEGNNIIIIKNNTATEFTSVSDLVDSYVGNVNSINIQNFTWISIK